MKFGIYVSGFSDPSLLAHVAREAERCGLESAWTAEHVVIPEVYNTEYPQGGRGPSPDTIFMDPVVPLAFAAALTTTLRLGTAVIILPQRNPLLLAKQMASLDVLSNGRAMLGIGSGWLREEFEALGVEFSHRGARTNETIEALRALWRERFASFHGKHINFMPVASTPKPVQSGGVPIHIGGRSPAAARRAGRYGDGLIPPTDDPEELAGLFGVMREEARKAGRDPSQIELSCQLRNRSVDHIKRLQDVGISRVLVMQFVGADLKTITQRLEALRTDLISRL